MSHSDHKNSSLQDLLDAITDAMLQEQDEEVKAMLRRANAERAEVESATDLIDRLCSVLVKQQPSEKFVRKLREDLIGVDYNVVNRLRYMPARVHIAAGLTLVAGGLMLVTRRRGAEDADTLTEIPVLQQQ